ncbi:hypothetical protein D3C72_924260 [compost metagenome]
MPKTERLNWLELTICPSSTKSPAGSLLVNEKNEPLMAASAPKALAIWLALARPKPPPGRLATRLLMFTCCGSARSTLMAIGPAAVLRVTL